MKGYKGFRKGLICRGKKYEENTVFEESNAEICRSGMHFCENPFDVLAYYPFVSDNAELNEFAEVESLAEAETDDGIKFCTKKLKVGKKLDIVGLCNAFVDFTLGKAANSSTNTGDCSAATNTGNYSAATNTGSRSAATSTGYYSAATNTGYRSAAANTGDCSAATNTGSRSAATNTGDSSAATNTGYYSAATNTGSRSAATSTGYYSAATNTGYRSAAANTGDCSAATNTGNYSAATNTGNYSSATVEGNESFAITTGASGKAKGALGCYIAVAEWSKGKNGKYQLKDFKAHKVDGREIKADTFYTLRDGEFVEVE